MLRWKLYLERKGWNDKNLGVGMIKRRPRIGIKQCIEMPACQILVSVWSNKSLQISCAILMKTSKTVVLQVQVLKNPLFELSLPKGVYVIYECKQSALCNYLNLIVWQHHALNIVEGMIKLVCLCCYRLLHELCVWYKIFSPEVKVGLSFRAILLWICRCLQTSACYEQRPEVDYVKS